MLTVTRIPLMVEKSPITRIVKRGAQIGVKDHLMVHEALPLSTIDLAVINAALAAVEDDNSNYMERIKAANFALDKDDGAVEMSTKAAPELPSALPLELIQADLNGEQTSMVLMVNDCNWRSAYRLAVITAGEVKLSNWGQYEHPMVVGPWIFFSDYFEGSLPCLGYTDWAPI